MPSAGPGTEQAWNLLGHMERKAHARETGKTSGQGGVREFSLSAHICVLLELKRREMYELLL